MKALQAVQSIFPRYDVDFCDACFCLECEQPPVFVIVRGGEKFACVFFFSHLNLSTIHCMVDLDFLCVFSAVNFHV